MFCALWNALWPCWAREPEQLERDDGTLPEPMRAFRWLAEHDGRAVGFAEAYRPAGSYHVGKWAVDVGVTPERRGRGVGAALFSEADTWMRDAEWVHTTTRVREDDPCSARFAEKRGFREIKRDFESVLHLDAVDVLELQSLRAVPEGLRLEPLAKMDTPAFRREIYELFEDLRRDIPRPEPPVRLSFEFFETHVIGDPDFLPGGTFVAMDGPVPVGLSGIYRGASEGRVDQWLTAVARAYRRRGVALALKAAAILWAREAGYATISTENDSTNVGMLAINDRLGFQREAGIISMRTADEVLDSPL